MSLLVGTNIRRDGSDPVDLIVRSRAMFTRFVPMLDHDLTGFLGRLRSADVLPVGVIARESVGDSPTAQRRALEIYHQRYGQLVQYWQIGNEYDIESDSSWTMSLSDLDALGQRARAVFGEDVYLICGGAADGSASDEPHEQLSRADLGWADAIAIHTYGQGVPGWTRDDGIAVLPISPYNFSSTVRDLINGYKAEAPDKDLWITEMGFRWDELGEARAAAYADAFLAYLIERCPEVTAFAQFCLTDDQVAGFGLYTGSGQQHQTAPIFARHAERARALLDEALPPAPAPPQRGLTADEALEEAYQDIFLAAQGTRTRTIVYAPHLGIVKYWREHVADLGSAVGPERAAETGEVFQAFALGVVVWRPETGVEKVA